MKDKFRKVYKCIFDKDYRFNVLSNFGFYDSMDDEEYLKRKYKSIMHKELDLDNPKVFNEKLQWLKINDHNPNYTMMVDKYKVRDYIKKELGEEYLIPLIGVWDNPDDIDFDSLPNQFVLKCNHNSGLGMCICKDKSKLDIEKVKKELRKGLKQDYYLTGREWPYKNVPRKIVAEKYMIDNMHGELMDYKFMCFNGKVECSFVCSDRFDDDGLKITFFDRNRNVLPFERHYPKSNKPIEKPFNYDKMIEFSEKLSQKMSFSRIDFYEIDKRLYFGEITFFPGSGFEEFTPESADEELGKLIKLPDSCVGGYLLDNEYFCLWIHESGIKQEKEDLVDYKFFCFNGSPEYCQVICDRSTNEKIDFFDMNWEHQEFIGLNNNCSNATTKLLKPYTFEKMKEFASVLAKNTKFVRIDFYEINRKLYFGEITFYPASGFGQFEPVIWNERLGNMIEL